MKNWPLSSMRHYAAPIVGAFLVTVVPMLAGVACRRDRIPEATHAAVKANTAARLDAGVCEEEMKAARRIFSNVVWSCIEAMERPGPAPYAMAIVLERARDAGPGLTFSVQMHGPRDAASKALEEQMVKCAVEEYRRCSVSYGRALWRSKDAKWVQMGRPTRDRLGHDLDLE